VTWEEIEEMERQGQDARDRFYSEDNGGTAQSSEKRTKSIDPAIKATPFDWPDPTAIPKRRWLLGYWLLRGEITAVVAPGGAGKSMFTSALALSIASGIDFLDKPLPEGACGFWLWNLEDDRDEMARQVTACGLLHGIGREHCADRLHVDSGLEQGLCTATEGPDGFQIIEPVFEALKAEIIARGISVLSVDPFVSSHSITENDNVLVDKVSKRWKRLASETGCAIMLVHHTKKMGGREVKAEDSRGAVSLINTARATLTLNHMTAEEAERFNISDRQEQRRLVRVDDDKPNRAPPESAWWFRKTSVDLGNGEGLTPGDNVGAAAPWTPPDPFEGLSTADLYAVQVAIDGGEWGDSSAANDWAGFAVAKALAIDPMTDKARIKSLLRTWKHNGALKVDKRPTSKGRDKPYLVVGDWVDPATLPTPKSGVGNVG
jgi:hypothetical protein